MFDKLRANWQEHTKPQPLPPLTLPSPEANNRAIAELSPEYIAQCVENFRQHLALMYADNVQLELPFTELAEAVV